MATLITPDLITNSVVSPGMIANPPADKQISVQLADAFEWTVRNGSEYGMFYVRFGSNKPEDKGQSPSTWIHLSIISSFGKFGYTWSHCGPVAWNKFLCDLNQDYAMEKLMGGQWRAPCVETTLRKAKHSVLEMRKKQRLCKEQARQAYNVCDDYQNDQDINEVLQALSNTQAFKDNYFEMVQTAESQQGVAFWEQLWIPWTKVIKHWIPNPVASIKG